MFNQFEPYVKATIAFLKLVNVKVNNASVNETLQNHQLITCWLYRKKMEMKTY